MNYSDRISVLQNRITAEGFDGFLITLPIHIRYISGFLGSNGSLLVENGNVHLFTDTRYITAAKQEAPHCELHIVKSVSSDALALAKSLGLKSVAVEGEWISANEFVSLQSVAGVSVKATSNFVEDIRLVKEPEEIAAIETACDITSLSWKQLIESGVEGKSELEISFQLEHLFRLNGAEDRAFDSIVATGPNSAIPHHHPTSRIVARGDLLKIDCGAKYFGYHADMTRTVVVGQISDWQKEIYELVQESQQIGKDLCKPGNDVFPINDALYEVIREAGYGSNILHASGHGVGLEIHERPFLGRTDGILAPCMPITVEPGIYLEGQGGVRIEDTIEVIADGYRDLTKATRDLLVV
ncbi:MAG: hypothetical protein RLZZ330_778 [Actinomycetota bacterium]|jgi:Xaa-Pro aminopeptidase